MEFYQTKTTHRNTKGKKKTMEANYQKRKDKMAIRNPHTSIITLNVNGLISPVKRQSSRLYQKQKTKTNPATSSSEMDAACSWIEKNKNS